MKLEKLLSFLGEEKLGFFGAGHLAKAFLHILLSKGFPKEKILVTHKGSSETRKFLDKLELAVMSNDELCEKSKVILYFVKPQDYLVAKECHINSGALVISFLAGVSVEKLKTVFPRNEIVRIMPSAPNTIQNKDGLCASYPEMPQVIISLFEDFEIINLPEEELMHDFCLLTCIPQIMVYGEVDITELKEFFQELPFESDKIISWAKRNTPQDLSLAERQEFLNKAATKGGINEAILQALEQGDSVLEALMKGKERSLELSG